MLLTPMHRLLGATLLMLLGVCATPPSAAVTLDFESLKQPGDMVNFVGTSYTEEGFLVTGVALIAPQTGRTHYWAGSTALIDNLYGPITLARVDGKRFTLFSMDLSEADDLRLGPTTVTFVGHVDDGSTLNASLLLDGKFGFEKLFFAGWTNLLSVTWMNSPDFHQFDNIVVRPLAEPGTLTLLGLSLAGLAFTRRRRQ